MKRRSIVGAGVVLLVLALVGCVLLPSLLRTENSAKEAAAGILYAELGRGGVRTDAFVLASVTRAGFDWIVTWRPVQAVQAEVGVTITPFEADVWGRPMLPDCKAERARTESSFGQVCSAPR